MIGTSQAEFRNFGYDQPRIPPPPRIGSYHEGLMCGYYHCKPQGYRLVNSILGWWIGEMWGRWLWNLKVPEVEQKWVPCIDQAWGISFQMVWFVSEWKRNTFNSTTKRYFYKINYPAICFQFRFSIFNNMVLPRPCRCLNRNNCPVCWTISGHRLPNSGSRPAAVLHFINQPGVLYTAIGKHYVATMW